MLLQELMDTPPEYDVVRDTASIFQTQAEINGRTIVFTADNTGDDEGTWDIQFVEKKGKSSTADATGSGGEFQVFSMVKASIDEFIHRYKPNRIWFTSAKSERARSSIYRRIFKKYPQYEPTSDSGGNADSDFFEYRLKH